MFESNFGGEWRKAHTVMAGFGGVAESRTVAVVDFGFVPVALKKGVSSTSGGPL